MLLKIEADLQSECLDGGIKMFKKIRMLMFTVFFSLVCCIGSVSAIDHIQSTADTVSALMINSTNHIAGQTGLTVFNVYLKKKGGNFVSISPIITEKSYGIYDISLTASNLDTLGELWVHAEAIGADPTDIRDQVVIDAYTTIYEDAEDNLTSRWSVYDNTPVGAVITNVSDTGHGLRAIQLTGSTTLNGYQLKTISGSIWNNTSQFIAEWSMKYSETFWIYFDCDTTAGHRYLYYTNSASSSLGSGEYVHHGLGASVADGAWHTFVRNLQADITESQPATIILRVNGILVRGSGRIDDVKLERS
jgi:hypothetical protein